MWGISKQRSFLKLTGKDFELDMLNRYSQAVDGEVYIANYGTFIVYANGILERSLSLFPSLLALLE